MTDFRYSANSQQLDKDLLDELTEHREAKLATEHEAQTERDIIRAGGIDEIAKATPLEQVKAIIEKKKKSPELLLKEHAVGKKVAEMAAHSRRAVDDFLGIKG